MADKIEFELFRIRMILKLTIITHPFIISEYPDVISEVVNMKQTGTVEDYYEELEGFCNMLQLSEEDALHIFINNLKSEISKAVSLFYPQTLTHALELAKQIEFKLAAEFNDREIEETEAEIEDTEFEETQVETEIEVGAQTMVGTDQVQLNEFIKSEKDGKLLVRMGNDNTDQVEQQTVADQNHRHVNKILHVFDTCEKFEMTSLMVLVTWDKLIAIMDPYGFRLLVMSSDHFFISGFLNFVKYNMHIDPVKYRSISFGFGVLLKEQGAKDLFMGMLPIVLVYNAHGACKLDLYEVFKGLLHHMLAKKRVGIKTVSLDDQGVVELWNLSSNLVFFENDVGMDGKEKGKKLSTWRIFSLKELYSATNNFNYDNKLGERGFGSVYWGQLWDGSHIAIKKLMVGSNKTNVEFFVEVEILAKVQHKKLLSLCGYCAEGQEHLIVYDYMPNLSLLSHLHGQHSAKFLLDWTRMMIIAVGSAEEFAYLYHHSSPHIIHRDIKVSNVLLDSDFQPHVVDFGFAKSISDGATHVITRVNDTFSYLAPEYAMLGKASGSCNAYNLGILLLDLASGKKLFEKWSTTLKCSIVECVLSLACEGKVNYVADSRLNRKYMGEELVNNFCSMKLISYEQIFEKVVMALVSIDCVVVFLKGLRMSTSIVVHTVQCFSTHQFSCLIGYGASVICPYLALETCRQWHLSSKTMKLMQNGKIPTSTSEQAQTNFCTAIKVLSGSWQFKDYVHGIKRAIYSASPPIVVAYAFVEVDDNDVDKEPIRNGKNESINSIGFTKFLHLMGADDVNLEKASADAFMVAVTTQVLKPNGAFIVVKEKPRERIFVFTTTHIERLDPALLRSGRMDIHIYMSYYSYPVLQILLKNYLGYKESDLDGDILKGLMGVFDKAEMTLAYINQVLIKNRWYKQKAANELLEALKMLKNTADAMFLKGLLVLKLKFAKNEKKYNEEAAELKSIITCELPIGWKKALPDLQILVITALQHFSPLHLQIVILEDKDVLKEGVLLHVQIYCHPKRRVSLK